MTLLCAIFILCFLCYLLYSCCLCCCKKRDYKYKSITSSSSTNTSISSHNGSSSSSSSSQSCFTGFLERFKNVPEQKNLGLTEKNVKKDDDILIQLNDITN